VTTQLLERRQPLSWRQAPAVTAGSAPPIIAVVDGSAAGRVAAGTAARLAREASAPLVLVYVRTGPPNWLGRPYFQRRLDQEMDTGRAVLADALKAAEREGVIATVEILEGKPARRVRELAELRDARMLVVGTRRRRLRPSISRRLVRRSRLPVLVVPAIPIAGQATARASPAASAEVPFPLKP
jgi:nucleotide-binding universal stress UspA family protein